MSFDDREGWGGEEESNGQLAAVLLDPIGVARRRWLPMALCGAVGVLVTVVATILWQPTYRAVATVLITSQQIPKDFVKPTVSADTIANIDAMLGEVLSAENLSQLIGELNLFGASDGARLAPLIARIRESIEAGPHARPSRGAASLVYALSYGSGDPDEAARVANALAALFVDANISRRNAQARTTTQFLSKELERDEAALREQAGEISEFRRAHRGELPDELPMNLRKLDGLAAQIASLDQQIAVKQDRILSLSSYGGDAVLSENEVLLGELRRQLARETAAHTDEHPNVIALRDRIARLEEVVGGAPGQAVGSARVIDSERRDIERLQGLRARAEAEIAELNERVDRTPIVAEQLTALEQKEKVLREDYLDAMRKVEDARLAETLESAQQGGQVSILDPAVPPSTPEQPRWMIALGGLAVSVGLALGIALLLELIDPVVLGKRQIQRESESPVLGSLPYMT